MGRDSHVFAFNANGVQYDAKNLDRSWNSGWKLRTRKTQTGWEAVATLPLSTFKLTPKQPTPWKWFCTREISRTDGTTHELSYQGLPLYRLEFPIVVD